MNLGTGELYKNGIVLGLSPQSFKILAILASHAGELVTRDQIQEQVWGRGTFVDFEHGMNVAIQKIRAVLGDDADSPRYIETLPRRGYRFIANVDNGNGTPAIQPNGRATVTDRLAYTETSVPDAHRSPKPRLPSNEPSVGEESMPLSVVPVRAPLVLQRRLLPTQIAAPMFVAVLVVASLWMYRARHASRATITFNARDLVLVSKFENRTGEPVLNGTVEFALERELSNSLFVSIAPAQRVQDTLRMMKKPLDSAVDASLGREVCLRDGGIRALVNGSVDKFGAIYTVSAGIINPINGLEIASRSVEARSQDGILPAVHDLSDQLRTILGEKLSSVETGNVKLEKVTTASLPALQFYSRAMVNILQDKWEVAVSLLEQAVLADPNFASAHILLAHCYSNFGKDNLAAPHYKKAFELADTTTDRERYFILGSYYHRYHYDRDKAIQAYETLINLYPDDFFGVHNLTFLYWSSGRWRDYQDLVIHREELIPGNFLFNYAAGINELRRRHVAAAKPYFERANALVTPDDQNLDGSAVVALRFVPLWENMRNGDVDKATAEADRLADTFESQPRGTRSELPALTTVEAQSAFAGTEGRAYLKLGRLKAAENWYQRESIADHRLLDVANVAMAAGHPAAAKRTLLRFLASRPDLSAWDPKFQIAAKLCAELRLPAELKSLIPSDGGRNWPIKFAEGALAVAQGRDAEATVSLHASVETLRGLSLSPFTSLAEDLLASALERRGDFAAAMDAIKPAELDDIDGPDLGALFHLARLYRKLGNYTEAQKVETDLLKRLKYADADHPILVQLRRQGQSPAALASNLPN